MFLDINAWRDKCLQIFRIAKFINLCPSYYLVILFNVLFWQPYVSSPRTEYSYLILFNSGKDSFSNLSENSEFINFKFSFPPKLPTCFFPELHTLFHKPPSLIYKALLSLLCCALFHLLALAQSVTLTVSIMSQHSQIPPLS